MFLSYLVHHNYYLFFPLFSKKAKKRKKEKRKKKKKNGLYMHNLKHIDVNNFESDATSTTFLQQITGD